MKFRKEISIDGNSEGTQFKYGDGA
jgi:hypothetical protein